MSPLANRRGQWVACGLAIFLAALALVLTDTRIQFNVTDIATWQHDWQGLLDCLRAGAGSRCGGVSKFPLAYLLNSAVLGPEAAQGSRLLGALNLGILLLPLVCVLAVDGRGALLRGGAGYLIALVLSPLPMFYLYAGALEVQAAVFCGIYAGTLARLWADPALCTDRSGIALLWISGLLFPLYKDTIAVFVGAGVLLLALVYRLRLKAQWQDLGARSRLLWLIFHAAVPVLLALAASIAYNQLKYGVPVPLAYVQESRETAPTLSTSALFLLGTLFSPNGGVLVFWTLPFFAALFCWRRSGVAPRAEVLVVLVSSAMLSCLAFAHWWAPFGWDSWGDRLMLQPMLSLLVAMFLCQREDAGRPARRRLAMWAWLPMVVCSGYYVAVSYAVPTGVAMAGSLWSGPACQRMMQAMSTEAVHEGLAFWKSDRYYQCARERMLHVPRM